MGFSEELRADADGIWQAHDHPVVRGIGDETLSVERFARGTRAGTTCP